MCDFILIPRGRTPFGQQQELQFLVLTKTSAASGDENVCDFSPRGCKGDYYITETCCLSAASGDENVCDFSPRGCKGDCNNYVTLKWNISLCYPCYAIPLPLGMRMCVTSAQEAAREIVIIMSL